MENTEFNLEKHIKDLADTTLDLIGRHQVERDIGLRNSFLSQSKDNLIEIERLMKLRDALKITVAASKPVKKPEPATSKDIDEAIEEK